MDIRRKKNHSQVATNNNWTEGIQPTLILLKNPTCIFIIFYKHVLLHRDLVPWQLRNTQVICRFLQHWNLTFATYKTSFGNVLQYCKWFCSKLKRNWQCWRLILFGGSYNCHNRPVTHRWLCSIPTPRRLAAAPATTSGRNTRTNRPRNEFNRKENWGHAIQEDQQRMSVKGTKISERRSRACNATRHHLWFHNGTTSTVRPKLKRRPSALTFPCNSMHQASGLNIWWHSYKEQWENSRQKNKGKKWSRRKRAMEGGRGWGKKGRRDVRKKMVVRHGLFWWSAISVWWPRG